MNKPTDIHTAKTTQKNPDQAAKSAPNKTSIINAPAGNKTGNEGNFAGNDPAHQMKLKQANKDLGKNAKKASAKSSCATDSILPPPDKADSRGNQQEKHS